MPGDQIPWSTRLKTDGATQPAASPHHGGGLNGVPDPNTIQWGSPNRDSLSGLAPTPNEAAEGYAAAELCRVTDNIEHARGERDLSEAAQAAFGRESFSEGFIKAQRDTPNCKFYLELQRLMVRAELQDLLGGRIAWPAGGVRGSDLHGPELWQLGRHLRFARINLLCNQALLKKAAESRDALLAELMALFGKSDDSRASIRVQLNPETIEHWAKYVDLTKTNGTANRGEAGKRLGLVMLAVLPLVALRNQSAARPANPTGAAPEMPECAPKIA